MKLKQDLGRRSHREIIYVDVTEEDLFNLRKDIVSYVVGRKVKGEEIREINPDFSHIHGLEYIERKEKSVFYEFYKHEGNGKRGVLAYFSIFREAHIEIM